mgnify:CR=1 FL=1
MCHVGENGVGDGDRCDCDYGERAQNVAGWSGDDDAEFAVLAHEAIVCFHVRAVGTTVTVVYVVLAVPLFGGDAPSEGLFLVLVSAAVLVCALARVCDLVCGVADAVNVSPRAVDGGGGLFHQVQCCCLLDGIAVGFVSHSRILSHIAGGARFCGVGAPRPRILCAPPCWCC